MKIKATLDIYYSKRDKAGNCYFAFVYTHAATGREARGTISGGESNIRAAEYVMNGGRWPSSNDPRWHVTVQPLAIRDFNRFTKDFPYAGCAPEDIAAYIKRNSSLAHSLAGCCAMGLCGPEAAEASREEAAKAVRSTV